MFIGIAPNKHTQESHFLRTTLQSTLQVLHLPPITGFKYLPRLSISTFFFWYQYDYDIGAATRSQNPLPIRIWMITLKNIRTLKHWHFSRSDNGADAAGITRRNSSFIYEAKKEPKKRKKIKKGERERWGEKGTYGEGIGSEEEEELGDLVWEFISQEDLGEF